MKSEKTKLPDGFSPTEETKIWSLRKHGYFDLPSFFISDFRAHHAAKGTKHIDWQQGLKNWINWASPRGKYKNPKQWEDAIEYCKKRLAKETIKVPVPKMRTTPVPDKKYGYEQLQKARLLIR